MTGDTFTERRGYVKKSSGFGGTLAMILGIGALVGVGGFAGLHYAATHGWDQPASTGPSVTEPVGVATEAPTTGGPATGQVETTSATLPITTTTEPAAAEPVPAAPAAEEKPAPKPHVVHPAPKPKPKPEPTNDTPADPFATQQ